MNIKDIKFINPIGDKEWEGAIYLAKKGDPDNLKRYLRDTTIQVPESARAFVAEFLVNPPRHRANGVATRKIERLYHAAKVNQERALLFGVEIRECEIEAHIAKQLNITPETAHVLIHRHKNQKKSSNKSG